MTILSMTLEHLTDDRSAFQDDDDLIFFSPIPSDRNIFPTAWLDLHVASLRDELWYEFCGSNGRHPFKDRDGVRFVPIPPRKSVRLQTMETIGIHTRITGLVAQTYSVATRGLLVTVGKIDPGYSPGKLALIVTNNTSRPLKVRAGDKIVCVAFAQTTGGSLPTTSLGWANTRVEDSLTIPDRFVSILRRMIDGREVTGLLIAAVVGGLLLWLFEHFFH